MYQQSQGFTYYRRFPLGNLGPIHSHIIAQSDIPTIHYYGTITVSVAIPLAQQLALGLVPFASDLADQEIEAAKLHRAESPYCY